MRRCYFSKNYAGISAGGNKARVDMEKVMARMGFTNIGLKQTRSTNKAAGFILTLSGVVKSIFSIRKGDILVLQYPLKKYYSFLCRTAHFKGAKVVTLVHDLGAFRRKRLTRDKEKQRLAGTDYIIALNDLMKSYLESEEYAQPIGTLDMWDYLSLSQSRTRTFSGPPFNVMYAGSLDTRKHSFFSQWDKETDTNLCDFTIYSGDFEYDKIGQKERFDYRGLTDSDDIIAGSQADFGLVWQGHSIDTVSGAFGEYLKINTPHKSSLYVRCHAPVIVSKESAHSVFVERENIGISVGSLRELDGILGSMTEEKYDEMKRNVIAMSEKLADGYFFKKAYAQAERILL